jgi:hypothetical protein
MMSTMKIFRFGACLYLLLVAVNASAAPEMRFVPDVVDQFDSISRRPDGLGFDIGDSPKPTKCKHYQGIVRGQAEDGTPILYVTKSGVLPNVPGPDDLLCNDIGTTDNEPGSLIVVRLGSRDKNGERLRSSTHYYTPGEDVVVRTITFDGGAEWPAYRSSSGWPAYGHPAAMQLIGDVLFLSIEEPYAGAPGAAVIVLDVSNAEIPRFLSAYTFEDAPTDAFSAGTLGVTPVKVGDACCRYLMTVTGKKNFELRFYLSAPTESDGTTNVKAENLQWEELRPSDQHHGYNTTEILGGGCLGSIYWPSDTGYGHQMLNFVRQGDMDGPLFLIGARNDFPGGIGADRVDLYEVNPALEDGNPPPDCPLHLASTRHLYSYPFDLIDDSANLAAGSGVYISPSGELIIYATDYATSDLPVRQPDGSPGPAFEGHSAPFVEWRHINMVRPDSPTLHVSAHIDGPYDVDEGSTVTLTGSGAPPIQQAWIETFDDGSAGMNTDVGWLALSYPDRDDFEEHYDDFNTMRGLGYFVNSVSSWRWFAPVGCTISANDYPITSDEFPGPDTVLLVGNGAVNVATDIGDLPVYEVPGTDLRISPVPAGETATSFDFNDDLEGITFYHYNELGQRVHDCEGYYGAPIGLSWDLDGNGSYETPGTSVSFSAATLDGPSTVSVSAVAQHPTDPTPLGTGYGTATVNVHNVAPTITSFGVFDSLGNEVGVDVPFAIYGTSLAAAGTFTDPGQPDHQTAILDWGDGTEEGDSAFYSFTDAFGGAVGELNQGHLFAAPGDYAVSLAVTDDDGGTSQDAVDVQVLSPIDAVAELIDLLDQTIAGTTDSTQLTALQKAWKALDGSKDGFGANGALDKLEKDLTVATLQKLRQALGYLEDAQAAGADVAPLIALLQQLIAVLEAM